MEHRLRRRSNGGPGAAARCQHAGACRRPPLACSHKYQPLITQTGIPVETGLCCVCLLRLVVDSCSTQRKPASQQAIICLLDSASGSSLDRVEMLLVRLQDSGEVWLRSGSPQMRCVGTGGRSWKAANCRMPTSLARSGSAGNSLHDLVPTHLKFDFQASASSPEHLNAGIGSSSYNLQ